MCKEEILLKTTKEFEVRFSEVDSMNIVWHGSYALYFEDAREKFGEVFGLSYLSYIKNGYYAPLVELNFSYKKPLLYKQHAYVTVFYRNSPAAKIIFDYEIRLAEDHSLIATGRSVQVFLDQDYKLVLSHPPFYENWKKKYQLL